LAAPSNCQAQDDVRFNVLIQSAELLYDSTYYLSSGNKYAEAFVIPGIDVSTTHRYNAACSWALAGMADSAFSQLFFIVHQQQYANLFALYFDRDLISLQSDKRWEMLIMEVKKNKDLAEAHLEKPLVVMLDSIYLADQSLRRQQLKFLKKHGWKSEEMQQLLTQIHTNDSINLISVSRILDERGWLGTDIIGVQGNRTLFLVIQHADLKTQEKYLPMMRDAVSKGNANASSLAMLEDRIALANGEKQIYGSQISQDPKTGEYYVSPLIDPEHVDERRAKVGLRSLQNYIASWGLNWDVEIYKMKLPEYEEILKLRSGK